MTILTDDPDWKRDVYEARTLAVTFVSRYGHAVQSGHQAIGNDLTATYYPDRSPMRLTVDATGDRVLSLEWKRGDAVAHENRDLSYRPVAIPAQGSGASAPMA